MTDQGAALARALAARFDDFDAPARGLSGLETLARLAAHRSRRAFLDRPVAPDLLRTLCAVALSAPSKSDLQQRDIVVVSDPGVRAALDRLLDEQDWIAGAPAFLVFCGNNRRQRQLHAWHGRRFANDHLDALFNAAVDAAIALGACVAAAQAAGLGCCPVSAVRNRARELSDLLGLPDHVFPLAGLALGWPDGPGEISPRLPLGVTVHENRFAEAGLRAAVARYDRVRAEVQPYGRQRYVADYGRAEDYGWSEDKARQYSRPERAEFGAFVRNKGFDLR